MKNNYLFLNTVFLILIHTHQIHASEYDIDPFPMPSKNPGIHSNHSHYNEAPYGYSMYTGFLTLEKLSQLISKIKNNPHQALDYFLHETNSTNGRVEVRLTYRQASNTKPIAEFQFPQQSEFNEFTVDFIVDERVKTNSFFMLEALIKFNSVFPVFEMQISEYVEVHQKELAKKLKHKKPHETIFDLQYKVKNASIANALGLRLQTSVMKPSGNVFSYFENLANFNAGSVYAHKYFTQFHVYNVELLANNIDQFSSIQALGDSEKLNQLIEFTQTVGFKSATSSNYQSLKTQFIDFLRSQAKQQNEQALIIAQKKYRDDLKKYKSYSEIRKEIVSNYKLNELVLNNDRQKVAELLNYMLPWDLMEPTEKLFWGGFIDAIRKPDWSKSELLYRGIDADEKMQLRVNQENEIVSAALFSKRLTAGSGSHFFKLLGLPETFEKFGNLDYSAAKKPYVEPHGVTNMMSNHASVPVGSPFISLSYSANVAYGFASGTELKVKDNLNLDKEVKKYKSTNASGGFVALRIDPRRLIINSTSPFEHELEVLASLLIFPDEIVYLKKGVTFLISVPKPESVIAQEKLNNTYYTDYETIYDHKYSTSLDQMLKEVKLADQKRFPQLTQMNVLSKKSKSDSSFEKFKMGLAMIQAQFTKVSPAKYQTCFDVFK